MIKTEEEKWLVQLEPSEDAELFLYCFAYAGGSANVFRRWPQVVPPGVKVIPIELPGHGKRLGERVMTNLGEIVEALNAELGSSFHEPFAFFGHSMGAILAFELTRAFARQSKPLPVQLFLSANSAPHLKSDKPPIYNLPDGEFIRRLRDLNGTPREVLENKELLELFLPVLRGDFCVCETYTFSEGRAIDVPITAICGENDVDVTPEKMEQWRRHTHGRFELVLVPGDHFFIHKEEEALYKVLYQRLSALIMKR